MSRLGHLTRLPPLHEPARLAALWRRLRVPLRIGSALLFLALLFYLLWPYATLWRLSRAVTEQDRATLAAIVDVEAVRDALLRRLNKERPSAVGALSDPFIEWLESGMRRHGDKVLSVGINLDWVSERLTGLPASGRPLLPGLSDTWLEGPRDFRARIPSRGETSTVLGLHLGPAGWRVTMIYY